jgi:hypothetical protein
MFDRGSYRKRLIRNGCDARLPLRQHHGIPQVHEPKKRKAPMVHAARSSCFHITLRTFIRVIAPLFISDDESRNTNHMARRFIVNSKYYAEKEE